jgi:hypothetical protein
MDVIDARIFANPVFDEKTGFFFIFPHNLGK